MARKQNTFCGYSEFVYTSSLLVAPPPDVYGICAFGRRGGVKNAHNLGSSSGYSKLRVMRKLERFTPWMECQCFCN